MAEMKWWQILFCRVFHRRYTVEPWGGVYYFNCCTCHRQWSKAGL